MADDSTTTAAKTPETRSPPGLSEAEHRFLQLRLERRKLWIAPVTAAIFGVASYAFVDRYDQGLKDREFKLAAQKSHSETSTEFLKLYMAVPDGAVAKKRQLVDFIVLVADPDGDDKLIAWAKARSGELEKKVAEFKQRQTELERQLPEAEQAVIAAKADVAPPTLPHAVALAPAAATRARESEPIAESALDQAVKKASQHVSELEVVKNALKTGPVSAITSPTKPTRYDGPVKSLATSPAAARSFSVYRRPYCVVSKISGAYAYCNAASLEACKKALGDAKPGPFKNNHECSARAKVISCYAWSTRDGVGPLASCYATAAACESGRLSTKQYPETGSVTDSCTSITP